MKTLVLAALTLMSAVAVQAEPRGQDLARDQVYWRHASSDRLGSSERNERGTPSATAATSAPEMDPGTAIAAFALLLGGLAVVNGNRAAGKKTL